MMYLTGSKVAGTEELLIDRRIGLLNTPKTGYVIRPGWIWAADNGCFGKGWPGYERWLAWLESFSPEQRTNCLFATAPDVVGDSAATLQRSRPWLPRIRSLGYPAALVTQDGLAPDDVPWDDLDWLFIGGTNKHKLGREARNLIEAAKFHGKRVHVGRVNSKKRFLAFEAFNCDTADGTFLSFGPAQNLPKLLQWIGYEATNPSLNLFSLRAPS